MSDVNQQQQPSNSRPADLPGWTLIHDESFDTPKFWLIWIALGLSYVVAVLGFGTAIWLDPDCGAKDVAMYVGGVATFNLVAYLTYRLAHHAEILP